MRRIVAAATLIVVLAMAMAMAMWVSGGCAKGKKNVADAQPKARANPRPRPVLLPENSPGNKLANAVMKASGGPRWGMVRVVGFRYVEREGDRVRVSRKHVWDVVSGVDTVTTGEGTTTVHVVSPDMNDAAQAAALRAWANDSHWLVAPLRLNEPGVALEYGGSATVNGKTLEILRVSFESASESPNRGGRYQWYIDPLTSLVMYSDELSEADPEAKQRVTWEGYRNFGPFKLSTLHRFIGVGPTISIEDLRVEW
jgi:hypothetical protein